jgi:hypothetical protein
MSKPGEGVELISPPPKSDGSNGKTTPVDGTSKDSRVEQLSSELKQLKLQRKIDKLKKKIKESKSHEVSSSSSSNEEIDASSKQEAKGKKRKREIRNLITLLPLTMIIYLTLTPSLRYPLVTPPPSPPILMGRTIPNGDTR